MGVAEVERYLNTSRNHALRLMEKIGKYHGHEGFVFRRGDRSKQIPSVLVYNLNIMIQKQREKLLKELQKSNDELSLYDVLVLFSCDLEQAKMIVDDFCGWDSNFEVTGNKVVKKNGK